MKFFVIAYDISDKKRLAKVRKVAYAYAFGGQKSAIESYLDQKTLNKLLKELYLIIDPQIDRINIIQVRQQAILLGKATQLPFDKGAILI